MARITTNIGVSRAVLPALVAVAALGAGGPAASQQVAKIDFKSVGRAAPLKADLRSTRSSAPPYPTFAERRGLVRREEQARRATAKRRRA
jgi:hypothetical protein